MFLFDDLDYLLAMRTAPHQSYRNWVERIMSILNLALQTQSVEREIMAESSEKLFKNLGSMNAIRSMSENHANLKKDVQESLTSVISTLNKLFSRLRLKSKSFDIGEPASEQLMDEMWQAIGTIDETVQKTDTTAKDVRKREKLMAFIEHCTVSRKYFFLVRKCGKADCTVCRPPRFAAFDQLMDFPDPEPRAGDISHFEEFEQVYGKRTTEKYCPSLKQMIQAPDGESTLPNIRMTAETVRGFVLCTDCSKPRCIYSTKKMTQADNEDIRQIKETVIYSCRGVLIPSSHHLYDTILVQQNITCLAPVCAHYYSSRAKFPPVCFNCGSSDLVEISNDLKTKFQSVHPVCIQCKGQDINERTRGAKKIKK